jgi:hypothetical protein
VVRTHVNAREARLHANMVRGWGLWIPVAGMAMRKFAHERFFGHD